MNIDWFTFVAQIVNFLVLVALLRWLLYGPIVRAIKKREEKIAGRVEEAQRKQDEAEQKVQDYEDKSRELDQAREELLKESRHDALQEHQRLLKEAKQEIARRREQWQDALTREQDDFLMDLRRQAGQMGLQIARHTLAQLADADLEQRMCDAFASRLKQIDQDVREEIRNHLNDDEVRASIRSAFDLSSDQRERFRSLFHEVFESNADIVFERSGDLICGLELDVGGYSLGWNAKEFLRELELEFAERLKEKS